MRGEAKQLRAALLAWYRRKGRDLPWRRTKDPYAIMVAEFMLQQTTVATVIPRFRAWRGAFSGFSNPGSRIGIGCSADWQGLGYYSRALNLHRSAKIIMDHPSRQICGDLDKLRALPGCGEYTARAIATFAFDQSVPIVEANTGRVLSRLFNMDMPIDRAAGRKLLWQQAALLVPRRGAGRHNSALIDLGATICVARNPRCPACPVKGFCRAKDPGLLPRKRPRHEMVRKHEAHAFSRVYGRVLLEQSSGRWRGMWTLPPIPLPRRNAIYTADFPFTHHRVTLSVYPAEAEPNVRQRRFTATELASIPIPTPHRRALESLLAPQADKATTAAEVSGAVGWARSTRE